MLKKIEKPKEITDIPAMNDDELATFWESHEPEEFDGWVNGEIKFKRPSRKRMQLRPNENSDGL